LQLNAFTVDSAVVLHFTKVLDVYEEVDVEDEVGGGQVDRRYWEKKASVASIAVLDKVVALVQSKFGPARVTYNKNHIALGTSGFNFCWFHPPKEASHCHLRVRIGEDQREQLIKAFEETGLYIRPFQRDRITIKLTPKDLEDHAALIEELLRSCEQAATKRSHSDNAFTDDRSSLAQHRALLADEKPAKVLGTKCDLSRRKMPAMGIAGPHRNRREWRSIVIQT
jgi:hypothetical protein